MVIFHSYVNVYQRVIGTTSIYQVHLLEVIYSKNHDKPL